MKRKKEIAIFSISLAAVLFITGCSSKKSSSTLTTTSADRITSKGNEQEESTPTLSTTAADSGSEKDNEQKEKLLVGSWITQYSKETVFTLNSDHTVTDDSEETKYWTLLDDGSLKIYLGSDYKICDTSLLEEGKLIVLMHYDHWTLVKENWGNAD